MMSLLVRPVYALAIYIGVLVWYPDYLRVSIGTLDISAGRIIVTVLLLRCLFNQNIRKNFTWMNLDTWVTVCMAVYVGMYCLVRPFGQAVENRGGFIMDTWFPYLAARMLIRDRASFVSFMKMVSLTLGSLAVLGVVEAMTGWQPYRPLAEFRPWGVVVSGRQVSPRWGFTRATGPFSHSILFGMCFLMFLPLIWTLRHEHGYWRKLAYLFSALAIVGAFSSMSSNPWAVSLFMIFLLAIERYKHWAKPLVTGFIVFCVVVEFGSSRPFYHVLFSMANFAGGTWWQRARIMDAALATIGDWWLAGYGGRDPGWGQAANVYFTDINNEFLLAGANYGIWGILAFCAVLAIALRRLIHLHRTTMDPVLRSWAWAFGVLVVGLIVAFQGVSLFGQNVSLFYAIMGTLGAVTTFSAPLLGHRRYVLQPHDEMLLDTTRTVA